MYPPVLDHDDTALKRDNKLLCNQQLDVIVSAADDPLDFSRIVDKPVIVCPHGQMEIQRLG